MDMIEDGLFVWCYGISVWFANEDMMTGIWMKKSVEYCSSLFVHVMFTWFYVDDFLVFNLIMREREEAVVILGVCKVLCLTKVRGVSRCEVVCGKQLIFPMSAMRAIYTFPSHLTWPRVGHCHCQPLLLPLPTIAIAIANH